MLPANRGELGQRALLTDNKAGFRFARSLDRKAKKLYRQYESMANSIIKLLDWSEKTNGTIQTTTSHSYTFAVKGTGHCNRGGRGTSNNVESLEACQAYCNEHQDCDYVSYEATGNKRCRRYRNDDECADMRAEAGYTTYKRVLTSGSSAMVTQTLETCFRCAEVGSTVAKRQQTTTYIPSYKIENTAKCNALKTLLGGSQMYDNLLSSDCHVNIYVATLNDLMTEFNKAITDHNIHYMGPMIKTTVTTMADATQFKKIDANGQQDKGLYAARTAYAAHGGPPWKTATAAMTTLLTPISDTEDNSPPPAVPAEVLAALSPTYTLQEAVSGTFAFPEIPMDGQVGDAEDMDALMGDSNCEDPSISNDTTECLPPTEILFSDTPDVEAEDLGIALPAPAPPTGAASTGYNYGATSNLGVVNSATGAYCPAVLKTLVFSFIAIF
jgi:hypothetical protein